jgi:hypothetical protein
MFAYPQKGRSRGLGARLTPIAQPKDFAMPESPNAGVVAERRIRPTQASKGADQRAHRRHCCGTVTFARLSLPHAQTSLFAWIHDISETGIGLDVLNPLPAGVDLVFELKRERRPAIQIHAQVVHATPTSAFYRLGCKLTRSLRRTVLRDVIDLLRAAEAETPN